MRTADQIRNDLAAVSESKNQHDHRGGVLDQQLSKLLAEARDHPELTMEEARTIPEPEIPRNTAYRMAREGK